MFEPISCRSALVGIAVAFAAPTGAAQDFWGTETPTVAEEPAKGPLIVFQRSLADAEAVAKETRRPFVVCINTDGDRASDVFALEKYRDPAFAALAEPYVAVVFSPNRHNESDHDELGRRILCPRFGSVTCGEHLVGEPEAFEKYMNGERSATRHVGVSPDGDVLFDRYKDSNLQKVDFALERFGVTPRDDRWKALFQSRDAVDRARLESDYVAGNPATRERLLKRAAEATSDPVDVLRLGLAEKDRKLRDLAREALAASAGPAGLELVLQELGREIDPAWVERWLATLERIGESVPRAGRIVRGRRALAQPARVLAVQPWGASIKEGAGAGDSAPTDPQRLVAELAARAEEAPNDGRVLLDLARANVELARTRARANADVTALLQEADRKAQAAASAGATPANVAVVQCQIAFLSSDIHRAAKLAEAALPALQPRAASREAALVVDVYARSRSFEIFEAERAQRPWPGTWLSESHAAYSILIQHPLGTAEHAVAHADLLRYFELDGLSRPALVNALSRFPGSARVHSRFRTFVEETLGLNRLIEIYENVRSVSPDPAAHDWFAGYAGLMVAEQHVRDGATADAVQAYVRTRELFDRCIKAKPAFTRNANHYVAFALAGEARLALADGELEQAVDRIARAFERSPTSTGAKDGLKLSPAQTLDRVESAVRAAGRAALVERLEALKNGSNGD